MFCVSSEKEQPVLVHYRKTSIYRKSPVYRLKWILFLLLVIEE